MSYSFVVQGEGMLAACRKNKGKEKDIGVV
jgi:hypothetical protein